MTSTTTVERRICSECGMRRYCLLCFHEQQSINLCQRCIAGLRRAFTKGMQKVWDEQRSAEEQERVWLRQEGSGVRVLFIKERKGNE